MVALKTLKSGVKGEMTDRGADDELLPLSFYSEMGSSFSKTTLINIIDRINLYYTEIVAINVYHLTITQLMLRPMGRQLYISSKSSFLLGI